LRDGVLPVGGVEYEQDLVRRTFDHAANDAVNLVQLAHQVGLRVQPAGGVHDQHVELLGDGAFAGVVGDTGRVTALLVLHNLAADALAPDRQLLDGRGAKGVAGGDHDFFAVVLAALGELGDRGGFARAVDAGDHDNGRSAGAVAQAALIGGEHLAELLLHEGG